MNSSKSYLTAPEHQESYDGLIKSYNLDKDFFSSYDMYSLKCGRDDKDKDEGPSTGSDRRLKKHKTSKDTKPTTSPKTKDSSSRLLKGTRSNYAELEYDFKECYKALSEKIDWENPEGSDYPFDLSKPLPLITCGNRQSVPVEFFIKNDLKHGSKLWSPVKVTYDKYALWGISHWRDQRKSFYAYAWGKQSRGDVYSTKRILAVTHVSVMRKHGYGYLEEIVVRRTNNALYKFKEGDFLRLQINDIEDMLLLMVQNRLTNLSGDDIADFAITLRMFTRSLVIQKRVEDLQLGVESYQKQINRNKLIRSDELYKFSDGTLTRLLSSLEDITKNINIEYLPKRRWSTLEKKRAHCMIKDINKLLKERMTMRSLENFFGGRLYGTVLRLLQQTI
nr:hypothetical protein [Tanacetum cinerariifolium]